MTSIYVLLIAIFSLLLGLAIYFMQTRGNRKYFQTTNLITWLLIALFPVLVIFSFFPESSISGTIKGISMGGAIAAFMFIWWFGTKKATETFKIDRLISKIDELEEQLANYKRLEQEEDSAIEPKPIQKTNIYRYKIKKQRNRQIAPRLLNEAINYLAYSDTTLEIVYFLVRTEHKLDICKNILENSAEITAA